MCMNPYNIGQALTGYWYAVWASDSRRSVHAVHVVNLTMALVYEGVCSTDVGNWPRVWLTIKCGLQCM